MAAITAIKPTRRDPNRATVRVGGKVVATLPLSMIESMNLRVGQPWTDELQQQVAASATYDKAYRQAVNRLNRRAHTARELSRKLSRLGHEEATVSEVIERLTELGLLDDQQYGEALLREMQRQKPAGPKLMRAKLYQKGVDAALIDRLVEAATDANEQREAARRFAERKLHSLQRFDSPTRRRRLYSALARRGFEPDVVSDVIESLRDQLSDADDA